jgi:hypothetical protein
MSIFATIALWFLGALLLNAVMRSWMRASGNPPRDRD